MKGPLTTLLLLTLGTSVIGQSQEARNRRFSGKIPAFYGAGAEPCREWTDSRKSGLAYSMGQWVLGYVSAVNTWAKAPARAADSDTIIAWIDKFCQANPLKNLDDAALELVVDLGASRE
jgi:hypothetical protein